MENHDQTNLDKVLNDILVHLHPDYLIPSYSDQVDVTSINKKKLNKYSQLLADINYFYKRVLRYETYFTSFYPESDEIEKAEALEYHIYSYMESLDILRNKIVAFLGVLKNDLKEIALNKQEVNQALKRLIANVEKAFDKVKEKRHPHHHTGHRFINGDIIDAMICSTMLKPDFLLRDTVNSAELKKRKEESLEKAQKDYINLSIKNNKQITGLVNTVFEKKEDFIYKILGIRHIVSSATEDTEPQQTESSKR